MLARTQADADAQTARWRTLPVGAWYHELNTPEARAASHRVYYDIARVGDDRDSPGAAWVGAWYARNLRIFDRLVRASASGERVLVLYGSGHAYLLDQFARESGAFAVADTLAYLPGAEGR